MSTCSAEEFCKEVERYRLSMKDKEWEFRTFINQPREYVISTNKNGDPIEPILIFSWNVEEWHIKGKEDWNAWKNYKRGELAKLIDEKISENYIVCLQNAKEDLVEDAINFAGANPKSRKIVEAENNAFVSTKGQFFETIIYNTEIYCVPSSMSGWLYDEKSKKTSYEHSIKKCSFRRRSDEFKFDICNAKFDPKYSDAYAETISKFKRYGTPLIICGNLGVKVSKKEGDDAKTLCELYGDDGFRFVCSNINYTYTPDAKGEKIETADHIMLVNFGKVK